MVMTSGDNRGTEKLHALPEKNGRRFRKDRPEAIPTPRQLADVEHGGEKLYTDPFVDPWGSDYILRKRKRGARWEAVSLGPDKKAGTDDDIILAEPRRGGL